MCRSVKFPAEDNSSVPAFETVVAPASPKLKDSPFRTETVLPFPIVRLSIASSVFTETIVPAPWLTVASKVLPPPLLGKPMHVLQSADIVQSALPSFHTQLRLAASDAGAHIRVKSAAVARTRQRRIGRNRDDTTWGCTNPVSQEGNIFREATEDDIHMPWHSNTWPTNTHSFMLSPIRSSGASTLSGDHANFVPRSWSVR